MKVIKRNGQDEDFDINKIEKVIEFACPSPEHKKDFISNLKIQLKDRMTTKELQKSLIQLAVEKIKPESPEYDSIAAKLFLYDLYKEAGLNRSYSGKFGYGDFYSLLDRLVNLGLYDDFVKFYYSPSEIKELGQYIIPERDYLLSYVGVATLASRYLVVGFNKEVYELPQEAFMGVAMYLASAEKQEDRVKYAKMFYDVLSLLEGIVATPTMANARKPHSQLSSCFIGTVDDSLESIMNVGELFSQVSKHAGGMGAYIGKIRAKNSDIRGHKNTSGGQVPWIRIYNDIANACNQLGVRKGAINLTNDAWHRDIFDFLQLKTNNGDDRMKAHDVFITVSVPDIFMKQLKVKGKWYLFCPHEIRSVKGWSLEDFYDDGVNNEFTKRYWECVNDERIPKQEINAVDILKAIIKSDIETGVPFLFFRDTVNKANPNKHVGMVYSTNLCVEIAQNMSANGGVYRYTTHDGSGNEYVVEQREVGDFVVCNLSSLNIGKVHEEYMLSNVVKVFIRMMDNVITLNANKLPVEEAKVTNSKYRAVGLGTYDYHHMLAKNNIPWESEKHLTFADKVYEDINYYAIKASMELAKEKGAYILFDGSEWQTGEYFVRRGYIAKDDQGVYIPVQGKERWYQLALSVRENGVRNAYLLAVAPNGSSAHYGNGTQSIDPVYALVFTDEKKNQVIPIVAPELDKINRFLYKPAHLIDQTWSIKANAARQKHIDQSQSFNLYVTPETKASELASYYMLAWETGCKTLYYTRSLSLELEDCESCSV